MNRRLRKDEFLPFARSTKGVVRINHIAQDCSGDSKSLSITTKENGDVAAICFRCGSVGFTSSTRYHRDAESLVQEYEAGVVPSVVEGSYRVPADLSPDLPAEAQTWLSKSGITPAQAVSFGLIWSESEQTLYIPITKEWKRDEPPELAGYIRRGFNPKFYLTLTHATAGFWGLYRAKGMDTQSPIVVLCEDSLSARKVAACGVDAIALCGVNLRPEVLQFLLKEKYQKGVVWLDGDNPQVRMMQRRIVRNLAFMPETQLVETGTDPKHESESSIKRLLLGG